LKTVNKCIVIKSNIKFFYKKSTKTAKTNAKKFHSLQSCVRPIWVNTRKRHKWF